MAKPKLKHPKQPTEAQQYLWFAQELHDYMPDDVPAETLQFISAMALLAIATHLVG